MFLRGDTGPLEVRTVRTVIQTPSRKHQYVPGDAVVIDVVDGLNRVPDHMRSVGDDGRRQPALRLVTRREHGYITRTDGHWLGRVPQYRVYLPRSGGEPSILEDRLTPVAMGTLPILYCKMPDGRLHQLNYLVSRPCSLAGDDPHLPTNWTPADRALWEGTVLARYYARFHPSAPREYWIGYPAGTTCLWHRIDPEAPVPQGGRLVHPAVFSATAPDGRTPNAAAAADVPAGRDARAADAV